MKTLQEILSEEPFSVSEKGDFIKLCYYLINDRKKMPLNHSSIDWNKQVESLKVHENFTSIVGAYTIPN